MAGVPGLEPGPAVLETVMLTIDTIPLKEFESSEWRVAKKTIKFATLHSLLLTLVICFLCVLGGSGSDGNIF
jgi:hypothetical protein